MFKNIKAAIFDMDGTLIDSMWLWKTIDVDYLSKHKVELPEDLQKCIEGMSFSETATYFKNRFNIDDDVESIKTEWNEMAYDYYINKVPLKDYTMILLNSLKTKGIKIGIGTSNSRELVNIIIKKFSLEGIVDTIRTSCEVEKGKPHPGIFLKVAEDLGVHPSECVVFEDVPNGILAANSAGMKSVAVFDKFSIDMDDEKRKLADYYIDSFEEAVIYLLEGIK